jgi:hypothetical protein
MTQHRKWRFGLCSCATIMLLALTAIAAEPDAARSSGWIALPGAEYQALHNKAFPVERIPEESPIKATLTRIDYDLRIIGEFAAGKASLTIDVMKDGWVRIPIPSALLVREARLDGKLVSLVSDGTGSSSKSVVFSQQGRSTLLLDIVLPVTATAANESISLPPATAGITRASIQLARQGVELKLAGGFLAEKSASSTESKWVAYGRGHEPLVFAWWKKSDDRRTTQPLRMRGSLTQFVGLGEDSTSIQAEVNAEIVQGAAQEVKIQIPDKVTINQVAGATVADWETKAGELKVIFLEPVEKNARFIIVGETRMPRDGQIDIPLLHMLNVEREAGGVAIEVLGAGEIKSQKPIGLELADSTDLAEIVSSRQSPSLMAFRFRSSDVKATRSLSVNVARYTQESVLLANIEEARYQVLMSDEGKMLVRVRFAVRNNQRNFLKVTLPKDAVVWSAALAGKPIRPGQALDGGLLLPLEKARTGEEAPAFAVEILYFKPGSKWNENGKFKLDLPTLDLPISRTGLVYYYPPLYKVTLTPEPGSFRTENFKEPISVALSEKSPSTGAGQVATREASTGTVLDAVTIKRLPSISNDVSDLINIIGGVIPAQGAGNKAKQETQALVDKYKQLSQEGKRAGILPINPSFPTFGPMIFLAAELTAENKPATIDINYEKNKKGGAK